MAKVGEGDPRWIVQDMSGRQDAHNVNNWYSTERDMLKQGKARLSVLLAGSELEGCEGWSRVKLSALKSCDGEVIFFDRTVSGVRKPTTLVDLQLGLDWEASGGPAGAAARGTAACGELSKGALEEGLAVSVSGAPCELRGPLARAIAARLDAAGRQIFEELHDQLNLPRVEIAAFTVPPPPPRATPPPSPRRRAGPKAEPAKGSLQAALKPPKGAKEKRAAMDARREEQKAKKREERRRRRREGSGDGAVFGWMGAAVVLAAAGVVYWRWGRP